MSVLKILRGPLAFFVMLLALIAAAHVGTDPAPPAQGADLAPYPASAGLARLVVEDPAADLALRMLVLAAAGAVLGVLLFAWTRNRIVSFLAAALFVLHPYVGQVLRGPDAFPHLLATALVLGVILAREAAAQANARNVSSLKLELLAVGLFVVAAFSGPEALATPLLVLLADLGFHLRERGPRRREPLPGAVLYLLGAIALWHFADPARARFGAAPEALVTRVTRHLLLDVGFPLDRATAVASALLAAGLLIAGLRSLRRHARWIVLHSGVALTWLWLVEVPAVIGLVPPEGRVSPLCVALLGFIPTSLAWKLLLRILPESSAAPLPSPPALELAQFRGLLPAWPDLGNLAVPGSSPAGPPPAREHGPEGSGAVTSESSTASAPVIPRAEIREAVETAVTAAVEAAVAALYRAERRARSAGEETAVEAPAPFLEPAAELAERELSRDEDERALELEILRELCFPQLTPDARVLGLGEGAARHAHELAAKAGELVIAPTDPTRLEQLREELSPLPNVSFVPADPLELAGEPFDLVVARQHFLELGPAQIFRQLGAVERLLKPGGRVVARFVNHCDPEGFREFQRRLDAGGSADWGRREVPLVTPEIVRTLAAASGLRVESFHAAAGRRQVIAVLCRTESPAHV